MTDEELESIISRNIAANGKETQTLKLFEEMAELQDALCKHAQGRATADHVCEEIADVMIMCLQLAYIHGIKNVENWASRKLRRLEKRLNNNDSNS